MHSLKIFDLLLEKILDDCGTGSCIELKQNYDFDFVEKIVETLSS